MEKPRLLIVDDDEEIRTQMKWALAEEYEVSIAGDRVTALELLKQEQPGVVTLDLGLPPDPRGAEEGFRTLGELLEADPNTKVIVVTGREERAHDLEARDMGAYDFFRKPIEVDELKFVVRRALHVYQLETERLALLRQTSVAPFEEMLGGSPQMQKVFAAIRKLATTDVPVLILGESGTGKEMAARAIHRKSGRKDGPFVAINCGAIPENLLESELFGHEKGSFTGAHVQRKGRIEMARGGTLLLDEIGELSPQLQVKLLRFLQEHQLERVGGRESITVDVRVLAATNVDLKQAMAEGRFREDVFYRLAVVSVELPPLRDRGEDVLLLAQSLLQRYATENSKRLTGFTRQAVQAMQTHTWPGNVRELENRMKRAVIMAEGPRVTENDLELATEHIRYNGHSLRGAREALEKELVQRALSRNRGNVTRAAADLGISRPTLHELIAKYEIER